MKGNLVIISSPSGGGKGTLIREVLATVENIGYSVSFTTRRPRFGEEDGRDYYFVSSDDFRERAEAGEFLEYAEVHGNMYGTSRLITERIIDSGRDVVLEIDVQGAVSVMEQMPDAVSIFILPPSYAVLEARLTARNTEDAADLALRLRNSSSEVRQYERFRYVVVNEQVSTASRQIAAIITAERQRRDRQIDAVQAILDSFAEAKHSTVGE